MDGFLQGTLPLTCLPHLDSAHRVPLRHYLGTRLGPGSQLLQGARPAGMKMGTSFKEKQVTVTVWPLSSACSPGLASQHCTGRCQPACQLLELKLGSL